MPSVSKRREANARLYDPVLGRFLSPDPYVQTPDFTQSFNRYSYCLYNPLCYVDKDGESFLLILAAVAGAYLGGVASNNGELNPLSWNWKEPATYLGIGVGAIIGYACGYGIANPGTFSYTFGINNAWVGAGLTLGTTGTLSNWDFHWSTIGGGGGGISNQYFSSHTVNQNIHQNILYEKEKWDWSDYESASMTLPLLYDDACGYGVVDDIIVAGAYIKATYDFINDNEYLIRKQTKEIEYWLQKILNSSLVLFMNSGL